MHFVTCGRGRLDYYCLILSAVKMGDSGGRHWLVRMEWHPARWSVCLSLLIFPCTVKSRSSLLAPAQPDGPRKRAVKRLWSQYGEIIEKYVQTFGSDLFVNCGNRLSLFTR